MREGRVRVAMELVIRLRRERGATESVGREIRSEIGAVAKNGAVLHEPITQKEPLPFAKIRLREDDPTVFCDDTPRNRRLRRVGSVGKESEAEESRQKNEQGALDPGLCDEELGSMRFHDPTISRSKAPRERRRRGGPSSACPSGC